MTHKFLLLCAGILIVTCAACALPPPAQQHRLDFFQSTGTGTGNKHCLATDFASAVMMLPNYVPDPPNPPTGNYATVERGSPIWTDLVDAFNAAPPKLQPQLCLTTVFITSNCASSSCVGATSWGFRDPTQHTHRYIGLSQGFWPTAGQRAEIYSQYETDLIAQVLAQLQAPWPTTPPSSYPAPPTFQPHVGTYDTSWMTVLAALAHEYGHILWYDAIKGDDPHYNPATFCRPQPKIKKDGFFDNSWYQISVPYQFLNFAALPTSSDVHLGSIQTNFLLAAINRKDWQTAASYLNAFYTVDPNDTDKNAVWPSLFGSVSPEEDFVETFKIYVMTDPKTNNRNPVTSMPLNLYLSPNSNPAYNPDVYAYIAGSKKKELKKKIGCIDAKF
jgi:hypothetical protein